MTLQENKLKTSYLERCPVAAKSAQAIAARENLVNTQG